MNPKILFYWNNNNKNQSQQSNCSLFCCFILFHYVIYQIWNPKKSSNNNQTLCVHNWTRKYRMLLRCQQQSTHTFWHSVFYKLYGIINFFCNYFLSPSCFYSTRWNGTSVVIAVGRNLWFYLVIILYLILLLQLFMNNIVVVAAVFMP